MQGTTIFEKQRKYRVPFQKRCKFHFTRIGTCRYTEFFLFNFVFSGLGFLLSEGNGFLLAPSATPPSAPSRPPPTTSPERVGAGSRPFIPFVVVQCLNGFFPMCYPPPWMLRRRLPCCRDFSRSHRRCRPVFSSESISNKSPHSLPLAASSLPRFFSGCMIFSPSSIDPAAFVPSVGLPPLDRVIPGMDPVFGAVGRPAQLRHCRRPLSSPSLGLLVVVLRSLPLPEFRQAKSY